MQYYNCLVLEEDEDEKKVNASFIDINTVEFGTWDN